jgi:hypothetical protein
MVAEGTGQQRPDRNGEPVFAHRRRKACCAATVWLAVPAARSAKFLERSDEQLG